MGREMLRNKRDRLQQTYETCHAEWKMRSEKLSAFRLKLAVQAETAAQFELQKRIEAEENRCKELLQEMDDLEVQIATIDRQLPEDLRKDAREDKRRRRGSTHPVFWGVAGFAVAAIAFLAYGGLLPNPFETIVEMRSPVEWKNEEFGIRVRVPRGWKQEKVGEPFTGTLVRFVSPEGDAEVHISARSLSPPISLEQYSNEQIAGILEHLPEARREDSKVTTLAGRPARWFEYSGKDEARQGRSRSRGYWMVEKEQVHRLTYTASEEAFDRFLEEAEAIVNSLEVK